MSMDLWGLSPFMQLLVGAAGFLVVGLAATAVERMRPARRAADGFLATYLGVDFLVLLFVVAVGALLQAAHGVVLAWLALAPVISSAGLASAAGSAFLVFVVLDFAMYWVHRAMHGAALWPVHRWHHSLTRLNWLSGVRSSVTELVVFSIPPLLVHAIAPSTLPWAVAYFFYTQIFIHLNIDVSPRGSGLARWIVLPEYHRVHHGRDARFNHRNFAHFWRLWDRWFGTELAAQDAGAKYALGLDREETPWKMAVGI